MSKLIPYNKNNSALVKPNKITSSSLAIKKTNVGAKIGAGENILFSIQKKVIKIDKLLKDSLALKKKDVEKKRISAEKTEFKKREEDLEKQKPKGIKGINLPSPPKLGIFDWIKNFIFNTLLGFIFVRLVDHLPKLIKLMPIIFKAGEFIIDIGGKLLDGLVTFIDWGYKAYDATKGFVKNLFGEDGAKQFDNLMGVLNQLSNVIILASLSAAMPGGPGGGGRGGGGNLRVGGKGAGRVDPKVARRYAQRFGRDAALKKFGSEGVKSLGGKYARSGATNLARNALVGLAGKGGAKAILGFTKPFLKRLPIIGGLIDFGLSVALGEDPGRAAFKAIGATLVGAVGAAIGALAFGAGAIIGGIIGGIGGDMLGGALYDILFKGKKPKQSNVAKAAGGGQPSTRGGKLVGGPTKRTIKKKKVARTLTFAPRKIKPGASVGGEAKVQSVFPNPEKAWWDPLGAFTGKPQQPQQKSEKPKQKTANPQEFLIKSNDTLGRTDFFGPFFTLAIKSVLGQTPDQLDYKNAGKGLNSWMQRTFASGSVGFAGGGEVDASEFFRGDDYTNVIAKSVEESVSKEVNATIRNLAKEMTLKPVGREEMLKENIEKNERDPNLDVGPGGTVTGGNADFWTLVAISRMEDSDPQGSADVAQSIYNRVASGIYGGKTIKEIVLEQGQYEPTWKYPRRGRTGVPNPEWHAIKDLASASAATGISQSDLQRTAAALRNSKYQEEARKFVGGRTDFMGGGNKKGAEDVQRTTNTPNNFFGWFVGPTAKAYGAKNPGPARAPQLGDIVVMGGGETESLGKGYGAGGSKIAGELGRYIKSKLRQGPDFSLVHRHPEHPPYSLSSGHSRGSLHYQGRAVDIGAYTHEQGPILRVISEFNKMKGVRPVQLLHGRNEPSDHSDHVHVAYEKGGETLDGPHLATIGEKGKEFVIDADSTAAIQTTFPGFLDAINKAKYDDAIQVLRNFVSYEQPYPEPEVEYVEVPVEVPVPMLMGGGGYSGGGGSIDNSAYETLEML